VRWLAPAAVAGLALVLVLARTPRQPRSAPPPAEPGAVAMNADEVVIDRVLLGTFDAVATLPDGEPLHLRCRQWLEAITLRDSVRGVEIQRQTPRVDVVPVSFETY